MSDPRRLLDGAGDDFEVALLSAGQDEQPSARAVEKTLLAIGAGGAAATGTAVATAAELATGGATAATTAKAATAAAGAAKAATAGATVAPLAAKASVPVLVAWTGVAAVGGLGTLTAIDYLSEPAQPAPVVAPAAGSAATAGRGASPRPGAPVRLGSTAAPDHDEAPSGTDADETAGADQGKETGRDAPGTIGEPQANAGGADAVRKRRLVDEVASLDRARTAIAAGDGAVALAALDHYDVTFETKMLGPEAGTLRIEALLLAGRGGDARAAAARFLADHPSSTHARRIRSLLEARSPANPSQP